MTAINHKTARTATATRWFRNRLVPGGLICLLFVLGVQTQQRSTAAKPKAAPAKPIVLLLPPTSTGVAPKYDVEVRLIPQSVPSVLKPKLTG